MPELPLASVRTNAQRALAAYDALQRYFFMPTEDKLYRLNFPHTSNNRYAYLWEFSRALAGTLALAGVPADLTDGLDFASDARDRFRTLERYWDKRAKPPAYLSYVLSHGGGDIYHDDNAWIALALVQQHRMGLNDTLERALQLFSLARSGWDSDARHPAPGGVFWVKQGIGLGRSNHDRGTGATAGAAELGYHLQLLNGSATSPAADQMLDWVTAHLDSSGDGGGPYWNAVRVDGSIDPNLWSYNQGVLVGAHVVRWQASGEAASRERAVAIANRTLDVFGTFQGQPPSFNAMLFQDLLMLYPHADASLQQRLLAHLQAYADWAWDNSSARDPETNLFYFDDAGRAVRGQQPAQLRDQGALTQIYALLAWPADRYAQLT